MSSIVVTVPGNPVPYARAQTARKFGGGKGRFHDPRVTEYLAKVRVLSLQATQNAKRAGLDWPRSGVRYEVLVLIVRETMHQFDVDNVLKSALDGATADRKTGHGGLWLNDCDVHDARVVRCRHAPLDARLVIVARALDGDPPSALDLLDAARLSTRL